MIDVDRSGPAAPPRRNGELVFEAPWEGRAFGMAVALLQHHGLGWEDFRCHLVAAIARRPDAAYYEHFVDALAALGERLAR
ncbi:MAG TPA: hypothetical protein VFH45_10630 [Acidimicrobiales bacterium]|nr:hypothetical protein [Acidimicrobiales bacterium]